MTDAPDLSIETWSTREMSTLLNASASSFEELAARLRELKDEVDAVRNDSRRGTYMNVALEAQKLVERNTSHAAIWRIAKVAAEADIACALARVKPGDGTGQPRQPDGQRGGRGASATSADH